MVKFVMAKEKISGFSNGGWHSSKSLFQIKEGIIEENFRYYFDMGRYTTLMSEILELNEFRDKEMKKTSTPKGNYAVIRDVPDTYDRCIKTRIPKKEIDFNLAKEQHSLYCETLRQLGLTLIRIETDDKLPDCCFVEDTAIIIGDKAIISYMGVKSRVGEEIEVKKILANYKEIFEIKSPATIEGGDVLKIKDKIFIGISPRTNEQAIKQVQSIVSNDGYQVIPVKINEIFHLKSACTYLGNDYILITPGYFDDKYFSEFKKIIVPKKYEYSTNCLSINGKVLIPEGYPITKKFIKDEGFTTIEIPMSEFRKGDGGLTCLSIIF